MQLARLLSSLVLFVLPLAAANVPLEIHIMSQCPDAQACVDLLIAPALEQLAPYHPSIDFRVNFIGRVTHSGITCKHGPSECLGNALHLCAAHLATPPSPPPPSRYFGFSQCLLAEYSQVTNGSFVRSCAEAHGVDFDAVNECAADLGEDGGIELLKRSVQRSAAAGVQKSCTVRLEEEVWCVRDGGEWSECPSGGEVGALVEAVKRRVGGEL